MIDGRATQAEGAVKVLMMPDFRRGNPYQQLLADYMPADLARVYFASGYRRGLPILREALLSSPELLHLHWFDPYVLGKSLHKRGFFALRFLADLQMLRARGVPILWTIHNLVPHEARFRGFEIWLNRCVGRLATHAIVHSQAARDAVLDLYSLEKERLHVIPHGHYQDCYPPKPDRAEARRRLGIAQEEQIFLFFGQLRPYKGLERLLDAWAQLQGNERERRQRLIVVGRALDPAFAEHLQQRSSGDPSVSIREGFVPSDEVPSWFAAADCAVLPFERILTSGSLLLAMSFGCPVIAPDVPMVRECLGPAFELPFQPGSTDSLVNALETATRADVSALRGRTAEQCSRFNWDEIARETAHLYLDAVGRPLPVVEPT